VWDHLWDILHFQQPADEVIEHFAACVQQFGGAVDSVCTSWLRRGEALRVRGHRFQRGCCAVSSALKSRAFMSHLPLQSAAGEKRHLCDRRHVGRAALCDLHHVVARPASLNSWASEWHAGKPSGATP
jgi:hypothetical protein